MRSLAVFDVDGTLALTEDAGDACWAETIESVFGIADPDVDWTHYRDVTDLGVTQEVCRKRLRRAPTPAEISLHRRRYVACLRRRLARKPGRLVPGANAMLARLVREGWSVAFATGAWRACFLVKAASAGLRLADVVVATSDDDVTRAGIVRAAIDKSRRAARVPRFDRIVSVGDGVWDARAARRLRLPFVGITASGGASKLRAEGVRTLVRHYRSVDRFLGALTRARPPR